MSTADQVAESVALSSAAGPSVAPEADEELSSGLALVAEDSRTNQMVASLMLKRLGWRVDVVSTGAEAVAMYRDTAYDLVFMDCHMPVMDGFQATEEIRRLEARAHRRVPIIATTASVMPEERERCLRAGMDDFVAKPIQLRDMRRVVSQWAPERRTVAVSATGR
jgi:CheY-like chemotaxis protein